MKKSTKTYYENAAIRLLRHVGFAKTCIHCKTKVLQVIIASVLTVFPSFVQVDCENS